jgi:hypothetical protein
MAVVKIPAFPAGVAKGVWANKLASAGVYAVESDLLNYDTGTDIPIFALPDEAVVMGIGLEVVTAFDANNREIRVFDSADTLGMVTFDPSVVGYQEVLAFKRLTKTTGAGGRSASKNIWVDIDSAGGTAGTASVWILFRPNRKMTTRKDLV